ncbi:MAG: ATP-dependent DNA helicase, partial [Pseudomonadota bacterium]
EERRLAYVGITRAKRLAKISFAQNRRNRGLYQAAIPSRFIDELPEEHVDVEEPRSPFGGAYQNFAQGSGSFGGGFSAGRQNPFCASRFDDVGASDDPTPAQYFEPGSVPKTYQTPGWQRAQRSMQAAATKAPQRKRGPMTIEGELVAASTAPSAGFSVGDRVAHTKFGEGAITEVDGNKLTVAFDSGAVKRVVDTFVDAV